MTLCSASGKYRAALWAGMTTLIRGRDIITRPDLSAFSIVLLERRQFRQRRICRKQIHHVFEFGQRWGRILRTRIDVDRARVGTLRRHVLRDNDEIFGEQVFPQTAYVTLRGLRRYVECAANRV